MIQWLHLFLVRMTILATKRERDALGIDTFERAFVYAALLLRAANTKPKVEGTSQDPYHNAVRITLDLDNLGQSGVEPTISIQSTIPYESYSSLRASANFFENLGSYSNTNSNPLTLAAPPTEGNIFPILGEPSWVNTLERYLAWTANNLICGFIFLEPSNRPPVGLQILEEATIPSLQVNGTLKFDINTYLNTGNIIAALDQQIESGTEGLEEDFVTLGTP